MWFTKAKRAQNVEDYESWISGGVVPTLNAMDNNGEAFATVLILMESGNPVVMRNREGCAGGGKGLMYSDKSFTLATSNDQFLIIDGTRVNDVRVYEDGIVPTVISRYGTGGGNVPMVFPIDDAREIEKHQNGTGIGDENAPAYTLDRQQVPGVVNESVVRRLTPMECERLQGFPDGWTDGQADSSRYKQMGNAVAVPVVSWIVNAMVAE
jgi:site-specific DNA-cytosine methylase